VVLDKLTRKSTHYNNIIDFIECGTLPNIYRPSFAVEIRAEADIESNDDATKVA